jgi:hypothetical protein
LERQTAEKLQSAVVQMTKERAKKISKLIKLQQTIRKKQQTVRNNQQTVRNNHQTVRKNQQPIARKM